MYLFVQNCSSRSGRGRLEGRLTHPVAGGVEARVVWLEERVAKAEPQAQTEPETIRLV